MKHVQTSNNSKKDYFLANRFSVDPDFDEITFEDNSIECLKEFEEEFDEQPFF